MVVWLVIFGIGALLLRAGFALQASGSLRAKSAAGALMRVVVNTAVIALVFWAAGAAILFQTHNPYFGIDSALLFNSPAPFAGAEFFHLAIVLIGGAVVAGAVAERAPFYVGVIVSAVLAGLIIPVAGNWIWRGWLAQMGFIDVGGAAAIHISAAACAVVATIAIGPRDGKYNKDGSSNSIPGHALPLFGVGILLLLVGWFPYLLGSVITHGHSSAEPGPLLAGVAMNLILAASAGATTGLLFSQFRYGKPDIFFTCSGLLGAMVAISAGVDSLSNISAVIVGAIAGLFVPLISLEIDMRWHLDDPVGVIGTHGIGGIWGAIAVAMFSPGSLSQHWKWMGIQALGIAAVLVLAAVISTILMLALKSVGHLRISEADEFDGLDLREHDINAYPDFQQTTIKSYHLREV